MEHKVFIAINPNQEIKRKFFKYQSSLPNLPIRWTKKENLHITLSFLGKTKDELIPSLINSVEEVCLEHRPFSLEFNKICYGPTSENPRMIWIIGKKSKEIGELKNDLEKNLSSMPKQDPSVFRGGFSPHITLGRIRRNDFREIEPEKRPVINVDISIKFEVTSIDIIESLLGPTGAQYTILQSVNLNK